MKKQEGIEFLRLVIREMIEEEMISERGLGFAEKTLTPRTDGDDLPNHAPVTTNLRNPKKKSRFKRGKIK